MSELIDRMETLRARLAERRIELADALGGELHDEAVDKLVRIHSAIEAIEAAIDDCRRRAEPQLQAMIG